MMTTLPLVNANLSHATETLSAFRADASPRGAARVNIDTQELVDTYYQPLYRFAYSLAKNEPDAVDLTQQTFFRWMQKGHQLRDSKKVKSWLFTTLHREFLGSRRRATRFPHIEMDKVQSELPSITTDAAESLDADMILDLLGQVDERFRAAVSLFYLKELSYKEIAEILDVPIGTVMSRISRGKQQLRDLLASAASDARTAVAESRAANDDFPTER